jgi:YegS/Rv2252/BmrU family lipid kinase
VRRRIEALWPPALAQPDVRLTDGAGDAGRLAHENATPGRLVVACGGDGTISEVAGGILDAGGGAELGLLPAGTGNDFARALGIPCDPAAALEVLASASLRRIDAGRVTFVTPTGLTASRWFVNSASFGMSGDIARAAARSRLPGRLAFAVATLRVAATHRPAIVQWRLDEGAEAVTMPVAAVALMNGCYVGAGMRIAPGAALDDGLLDAVLIRPVSFLRVLVQGLHLYRGTHLRLPEVSIAAVRRVKADADRPLPIEVDGETPGFLPATITLHPAALRLRR